MATAKQLMERWRAHAPLPPKPAEPPRFELVPGRPINWKGWWFGHSQVLGQADNRAPAGDVVWRVRCRCGASVERRSIQLSLARTHKRLVLCSDCRNEYMQLAQNRQAILHEQRMSTDTAFGAWTWDPHEPDFVADWRLEECERVLRRMEREGKDVRFAKANRPRRQP